MTGIFPFLDRETRCRLFEVLLLIGEPGRTSSPVIGSIWSILESEARASAISWLRRQKSSQTMLQMQVEDEEGEAEVVRSMVPLLRGTSPSWIAILDEIESWTAIREVVALDQDSLAPDAVRYHISCQLRAAEDFVPITFPSCFLYYSRMARYGYGGIFDWRVKIVRWLRALSSKYKLTVTTASVAIALADSYVACEWQTELVSSGQLQMIYVAALLCAAADVPERSAPEDCLASIRASAPHAPSDLRACEAKLRSWSRRVLHPRLNAHAAKGPAERSVLDRMPSLSGLLPMPLLHVLVATQPIAFAGPLIALLPADWSPQLLPAVLEALYVAMLEVDAQQFSPQTVAIAAIYVALCSTGLAARVASTLWLVLVRRALHVDATSIRLCSRILRLPSGPADRKALAEPATEQTAAADSLSAAAVAAAAHALSHYLSQVNASPASLALSGIFTLPPHPPAPITTGSGPATATLARLHPRTFIEAVTLEAELRGADADAVDELLASLAPPDMQARMDLSASPRVGLGAAAASSASSNPSAAALPDALVPPPPLRLRFAGQGVLGDHRVLSGGVDSGTPMTLLGSIGITPAPAVPLVSPFVAKTAARASVVTGSDEARCSSHGKDKAADPLPSKPRRKQSLLETSNAPMQVSSTTIPAEEQPDGDGGGTRALVGGRTGLTPSSRSNAPLSKDSARYVPCCPLQ